MRKNVPHAQGKDYLEQSGPCGEAIHHKEKDGSCTFYHNYTLRITRHMERYGLMAVVPTLTAFALVKFE